MKDSKIREYSININGADVAVSKEVYEVYEEQRKDGKNRRKRDKRNRLVSYHNLDTDELAGEEILYDSTEESTVEKAERALMAEKLHILLSSLLPDEQEVIRLLFFKNMSEREAAEVMGVSSVAIHKKKDKILYKLHKLVKK